MEKNVEVMDQRVEENKNLSGTTKEIAEEAFDFQTEWNKIWEGSNE